MCTCTWPWVTIQRRPSVKLVRDARAGALRHVVEHRAKRRRSMFILYVDLDRRASGKARRTSIRGGAKETRSASSDAATGTLFCASSDEVDPAQKKVL